MNAFTVFTRTKDADSCAFSFTSDSIAIGTNPNNPLAVGSPPLYASALDRRTPKSRGFCTMRTNPVVSFARSHDPTTVYAHAFNRVLVPRALAGKYRHTFSSWFGLGALRKQCRNLCICVLCPVSHHPSIVHWPT